MSHHWIDVSIDAHPVDCVLRDVSVLFTSPLELVVHGEVMRVISVAAHPSAG